MIFFQSFITLLLINFIYFSYGFTLSLIFKINKNKIISVFLGISLISIITNILYFKFNFKIFPILIFIILLLIVINFVNFFKNKFYLKIYLSQIIYFIPIFIFGSLLAELFQEQFYIFRGNHYDSINYTSMSLLFSKYNFEQLKDFYYNENNWVALKEANPYFGTGFLLFFDRTLVPILNSYLYIPKLYNIFFSNFLNKIFFLSLVPISFFLFIKYLKLRLKYLYITSQIVGLSFWSLYVFEIEAWSQLSTYSFSILSLGLFFYINLNLKKIDIRNLMGYSFIFATFFSLYPEQAIVFFAFYLIYFFINNFFEIKYRFKNIFIIFLTIILLILLSPNILSHTLRQISHYNTSNIWWAYYGAFILGSDNLILDGSFVLKAKEFLENNSVIEFAKFIYNQQYLSDYKYFMLNIIPSFFGLYFISLGKLSSYSDYLAIVVILQLLLNLCLIYFVSKNFYYLFKYKNTNEEVKYFKYLLFYFLVLLAFLMINGSFWQIIKLYFYFSLLLFLLVCFDFKNIIYGKLVTNKLLILLIAFFPFYKFTSYNFGISKIDSFPSILHKNLKINYNWSNLLVKKEKCQKVIVYERNEYMRILHSQFYAYYDINYEVYDQLREDQNTLVLCKKKLKKLEENMKMEIWVIASD